MTLMRMCFSGVRPIQKDAHTDHGKVDKTLPLLYNYVILLHKGHDRNN